MIQTWQINIWMVRAKTTRQRNWYRIILWSHQIHTRRRTPTRLFNWTVCETCKISRKCWNAILTKKDFYRRLPAAALYMINSFKWPRYSTRAWPRRYPRLARPPAYTLSRPCRSARTTPSTRARTEPICSRNLNRNRKERKRLQRANRLKLR